MVQFRIESPRFQLQVANVTIPGFCIYCRPDRNARSRRQVDLELKNPPEEELPEPKSLGIPK